MEDLTHTMLVLAALAGRFTPSGGENIRAGAIRRVALSASAILAVIGVVDAARAADVPCTSGPRGAGSVEQQMCLAEHIPGFGGYYHAGPCRLMVYLTDSRSGDSARATLERWAKATLPKCRSRVSVDIREGEYEFTELYRWGSEATDLILFDKATKIPGAGGMSVPFIENRIGLHMDTEETVAKVKEVLRDQGLPLEAFRFSSREAQAETVAAISIAPTVREGTKGKQVIVPVFKWGGDVLGELIMGQSSQSEALSVAPAFPGYGPKKPGKPSGVFTSDEQRQVTDAIRQIYNPAFTQSILGFNRRKKLIFVQHLVEPARAARLADQIDVLVEMHEIHRASGMLVRRGRLTPCVVVETASAAENDMVSELQVATFLYTCETGR